MGRSGTARFLKSVFRVETLKNLLIYILVPFLCLGFLAQPIGNAVRGSAAAAFLIPAAALGLVALNWYIHTVVRRERPTLLVYAHGVFCVLVTAAIAYAALPGYTEQASTLAVIGGCLTLVSLFLFSFHLASRRSRPAHAFAVSLWLVIGTIAFFMAYRIFDDVRIRRVNQDTWITALVLLALIPVPFARRIRYAVRLAAAQRSASCPAAGRITQVVGETFLDRDGDPFTHYIARILYTVDGVPYETDAEITGSALRKYGRKAFVGQEINVCYNPDDPADAFTRRIDRKFFDVPRGSPA